MKAVILETRKNKAVALADDGRVNEVSNKNYKIGQTIEMERNVMTKMSKKYRNIAAGIAASLVILLGAGTAYAYNTPVAHISLDVNPSITYSVNAFNRVIHVDRNADAAAILQTIDWDGVDINKVIEKTILALKATPYLESDKWYEDGIVIGVNAISKNKENQLILAIKEELAKIVREEDPKFDTADVSSDVVIGVGAERVAEAAALGVTPGKLNLVQKLEASYVAPKDAFEITSEAIWLKGPVKDIMAQIKANRLALKDKIVEGTDPVLNDESKMNDNGNNGIGNGEENGKVKNNGNGNINNNGIGEGKVNDDKGIDDFEDEEDDDEEDN